MISNLDQLRSLCIGLKGGISQASAVDLWVQLSSISSELSRDLARSDREAISLAQLVEAIREIMFGDTLQRDKFVERADEAITLLQQAIGERKKQLPLASRRKKGRLISV